MHSTEKRFLAEVKLFRRWIVAVPPDKQGMEWEFDYDQWDDIWQLVIDLLSEIGADGWAESTVDELLYIVDADHNYGRLAAEIAKYPEMLLQLTQTAIRTSYTNAKWQFAVELGNLHSHKSQVELLLVALAKDADEYTSRRALGALAEANSPMVNELVKPAWASGHQYQRIMVLSALHRIASPDLEKYLKLADADGREYLVAWAARVRRGETD